MKTLRLFGKFAFASCLAVAMSVSFTSCSDDDEPEVVNPVVDDDDIVMDISAAGLSYDENGAWVSAYDTEKTSFDVQNFNFTHEVSAYEWDGVMYYSWKGFCPSKSADNADHSDEWWVNYQWGSMTGGGCDGTGKPFILGMWDVNETLDEVPASPACAITYNSGAVFDPEEIYVTNSAYGYYGIKNGSAYNHAFTSEDWFKLHIKGVRNGEITGTVEVYLANGTDILSTWKRVDLDPLGDAVDMIYFQLTSSDTGQWGMNNPAYFCLDRLVIDKD